MFQGFGEEDLEMGVAHAGHPVDLIMDMCAHKVMQELEACLVGTIRRKFIRYVYREGTPHHSRLWHRHVTDLDHRKC